MLTVVIYSAIHYVANLCWNTLIWRKSRYLVQEQRTLPMEGQSDCAYADVHNYDISALSLQTSEICASNMAILPQQQKNVQNPQHIHRHQSVDLVYRNTTRTSKSITFDTAACDNYCWYRIVNMRVLPAYLRTGIQQTWSIGRAQHNANLLTSQHRIGLAGFRKQQTRETTKNMHSAIGYMKIIPFKLLTMQQYNSCINDGQQ